MALAQSQYLRIFDAAGGTYHRWQSYYANVAVSWEGAAWSYVAFVADGFTAGVSNDDAAVSVSAPAIPLVVGAFEQSMRDGLLAELLIYQFDPQDGNDGPQEGQDLVGRYVGQVVGGSGSLTSLTLSLGSALAPVGSQVPPRKLTTYMMGQGCRL